MGSNGLAGSAPTGTAAGIGAGGGHEVVTTSAGAGGTTKPKIRSSKNKPKPGIYSVKEYIVTEDTLNNIGTLRTSVTFWSSVGSLGLGFVLSTYQSLTMAAGDADNVANATWWVYLKVGVFITVVAYLAALVYFVKGKSVLQFVKDHTTHEED